MSSEKPNKPTYTLDIFNVLDKINRNDFDFFSTLNEAEQKAFQPYVAMKWMFGANDSKHLLALNQRANRYMFSLGQHKELLYKLLCASTNGKSRRYKWIKTATSKKVAGSVSLSVVKEMYGYSDRQAKEALLILNKDDILELAQYLGRQTEELTKIKNEFKSSTKD